MVRWLLALTMLFAVPAQAQAPAFNPAASYITAGQDEPGYRSWALALPSRLGQVKAFNDYLAAYQVSGVVPTWQLLRTATQWAPCGGQPFELPPTSEWPNIVQTLRYVRDYVVPAVGPVEPVSAYRNPALNACAGGAQESAHKHYSAIDMVPLQAITRESLMRRLCSAHASRGPDYGVGLGFYAFLRFHVDTTRYRRWNMDPAVASHCPPIVRPPTIAQVVDPAAPAVTVPIGSAPVPPPAAAPVERPKIIIPLPSPVPPADPLAPQR